MYTSIELPQPTVTATNLNPPGTVNLT